MAGGGLSFSMGAKKGPKLAFGLKSNQSAVKAPAVFAPDSDDEKDPAEQDQKRQRTTGLCSLLSMSIAKGYKDSFFLSKVV